VQDSQSIKFKHISETGPIKSSLKRKKRIKNYIEPRPFS
jgi:hypothetical protein